MVKGCRKGAIAVGSLAFDASQLFTTRKPVRMSKGLGKRQRDILAKLAEHRANPPDYNGNGSWHKHWKTGKPIYSELPKSRHDQYPGWMTMRELAGLPVNDMHNWHSSDVESTRRAVHKLEAAGLVETTTICRNQRGQCQIGV